MTTQTTNSPNLAAKNLLAKLMATEDITVEHDAKAQTASFNMDTRVLTLPVWKDLDADTLDMLIGHEVSHALHTPAGRDPLIDACKKVDPKNPMVAKDYLNIVEDARIERMIKARFPGLKKSFAAGYRDLLKRDIFGLKKVGGDLSSLTLIDRINLQYKIGWLLEVPFTEAELTLAQRVATTITWDDVVALSKEIYEFAKANRPKKNPENQPPTNPTNPEDGDDEGESDGKSKGEKGESEDGESEGNESGESDGENAEGEESDADGEGEESDADGEGEGEGEGEESDAEGEESKQKPSKGGDKTPTAEGEASEGEASEDEAPAPVSETLKNAENGLQDLVDKSAVSTYYADLPEIDKGFVVTLKQSQESLRKWATTTKKTSAAQVIYASWKSNNGGAVQVLATEFDRRKAADAHKRTAVAEMGSLDPNRLHAYRIAEDIFLQNAYVKDGKNHGLVLLLDMSGSMAAVFHDTMIQLVTLAHFCRRVNIPFTFYGFTDRASQFGTDPSFKDGAFGGKTIKTRLVTLLQDGMKMNEFYETCGLLLLSSYDTSSGVRADHPSFTALRNIGYSKGWHGVEWMYLDNTPTNAALLGLPSIMEEFKRVKRVQVMNLIVLTDGEATDDLNSGIRYSETYVNKVGKLPSGYGANPAKIVWRDQKRRKDYSTTYSYQGYSNTRYETDINREQQSGVLLQIIRDRVGGKAVCLHLVSRKQGGNHINHLVYTNGRYNGGAAATAEAITAQQNALTEQWKENDWVGIAKTHGFDDYILIRCDNNDAAVSTDDVDLTGKNAIRDLRKAFTKSMASTKANRPLLTRVADLISK